MSASTVVQRDQPSVTVRLPRWINLEAQGWIGVEEHLHYDRMDQAADAIWFTLLEADGLAAGHFMSAKGGYDAWRVGAPVCVRPERPGTR